MFELYDGKFKAICLYFFLAIFGFINVFNCILNYSNCKPDIPFITLFNEFGDSCESKMDERSNETVAMILAAAKISVYDDLTFFYVHLYFIFCIDIT